MTAPDLPDVCWPISYPTGCTAKFNPATEGYDADVAGMADALAVSTLQVLTAYQVGGCPVVFRPASRRCWETTWGAYPVSGRGVGSMSPRLDAGTWINITCGCGTGVCGCGPLTQITLPGGARGTVVEVEVDGTVLDPSAYVLSGGRLWRVDGGTWPRAQDLSAALGEPGSFAVTYTAGAPVDGLGARAAGLLACEYAKALAGDDCELPRNVTQIVRNNVAMTLADPQGRLFPNGLTGISLVDTYVARWNPHGLRVPSTVWSPDVRPPLVTPGT